MRGATRGQGRGVGRRKFQPTRPLRGATGADCTGRRTTTISTHAPLAGRDSSARSTATRARRNFNPRAPCGARLWPKIESATAKAFQPTRPLRGATRKKRTPRRWHVISTHAPLAGRDRCQSDVRGEDHIFQPTRPLRGATSSRLASVFFIKFQPTRPLRGATSRIGTLLGGETFQPTRPLRGATSWSAASEAIFKFQPTRPLRGATRVVAGARLGLDISTHAPLAGRDSKSVQITMHIFAITDKFQMLLHRMPPVRAFCSFLTQENHADLGANRPSDLCALVLRTIRSSVPRADTSACSRSVRFYSRTSCPSSKIEGCPFLGQ